MCFKKTEYTAKGYYDSEKFTIKSECDIGLTRYQMFDDGISQTKNQQWITAYYTLLIQGALIAFHTVFKELKADCILQIIEVIFLGIASICTAFAGCYLICGYSEKLKEYRMHVDKLLKNDFIEYEIKGFEKFITNLFKVIFFVSSFFVIFYIIVSCFY